MVTVSTNVNIAGPPHCLSILNLLYYVIEYCIEYCIEHCIHIWLYGRAWLMPDNMLALIEHWGLAITVTPYTASTQWVASLSTDCPPWRASEHHLRISWHLLCITGASLVRSLFLWVRVYFCPLPHIFYFQYTFLSFVWLVSTICASLLILFFWSVLRFTSV